MESMVCSLKITYQRHVVAPLRPFNMGADTHIHSSRHPLAGEHVVDVVALGWVVVEVERIV